MTQASNPREVVSHLTCLSIYPPRYSRLDGRSIVRQVGSAKAAGNLDALQKLARAAGEAARKNEAVRGIIAGADVLVPVPSKSPTGKVWMTALSRAVARNLQVPVRPEKLRLVREVQSQRSFGYNSRQRDRRCNVDGAFDAKGVSNQRVILLDDVATSGATLSSAADALFRAGARNVYPLVLECSAGKTRLLLPKDC